MFDGGPDLMPHNEPVIAIGSDGRPLVSFLREGNCHVRLYQADATLGARAQVDDAEIAGGDAATIPYSLTDGS